MAFSSADLMAQASTLLADKGYQVHQDEEVGGWWFTWGDPAGVGDPGTGEVHDTEGEAWAEALGHYFENSAMELHRFAAVRHDRFIVIAWPEGHDEELSDYAADIQSTLNYAQSGGARVYSVLPDQVAHALNAAEGEMA